MKSLVVFYSRTDYNRRVAKEIADSLKADMSEVLPQKNYKGFFGFLRGGYQAAKKKEVMISSPKKAEDYELVVLVSPLWAGALTPPVRSYILRNKFKKIAFFSCNGNGKAQKSLEQLRELKLIPLETGFVSEKEVKDNLHHEKIIEFCDSVRKLMKK
jgi:flavodoxin